MRRVKYFFFHKRNGFSCRRDFFRSLQESLQGRPSLVVLCFFSLIWLNSCGVHGRPQPPAQPQEMGDGVPEYYKKSNTQDR